MINELRGSRPFPIDIERKERCQTILSNYGMTMTELAFHIGIKKAIYQILSLAEIYHLPMNKELQPF